jgi:hypothetical protein
MNSLDSKQDKNKNELCAKFWRPVILSTEQLSILTTDHFAIDNFVKVIWPSFTDL